MRASENQRSDERGGAAASAPWSSPLSGARPDDVRRRRLPLLLGLLALCAAIVGLVYGPPLAQGAPVSLQTVTYRPPQGPTSPILLDSRPEVIIHQYLMDYLRLAGTYPCVSKPDAYRDLDDPFLRTGHCQLVHPVVSFTSMSVTIQAQGLNDPPSATVYLRVVYHDGSQWVGRIKLVADQWQGPWPFSTHLTCWASFSTLVMFGQLTPDIPSGANYETGDSSHTVYHCNP